MGKLDALKEKLKTQKATRDTFDTIDVEFRNDTLSIYLYREDGKGRNQELHIMGKENALWLAEAIKNEAESIAISTPEEKTE